MAEPLLHVRGLQGFYGESHVLHGVDLDVFPGETVTLLGRNGAGKTTTLRAIMGILRRRQGTIRMGAVDLLATPPHRIARAGIGYVPEERGIFASLSVAENLTLPPKVAEGGMSLAEIHRLFPNLAERAAARAPSCRAASSRCWRSPGCCAPACACCCWTSRPRGWRR